MPSPSPSPSTSPSFIINELDTDQVGTDAAEFIEIYDGGAGNTSLSGHVLVFFNGSNDLSYFAIDLIGSTNAQGYYTVGNTGVAGVDQTFTGNLLQNGADAVALYKGSVASFPNGTGITTSNLLDAVVYDNGQADDPTLLMLLNSGQPQVNENTGGASTTNSLQRCPNGGGGAGNTTTYAAFAPTPDSPNNCGVAALPLWKKLLLTLGVQVSCNTPVSAKCCNLSSTAGYPWQVPASQRAQESMPNHHLGR